MMNKAKTLEEGLQKIENTIKDGSALFRFQQMLIGQNVNLIVAEKLCKEQDTWQVFREANRTAKHIAEFCSTNEGKLIIHTKLKDKLGIYFLEEIVFQ